MALKIKKAIRLKSKDNNFISAFMNPIMLQIEGQIHQHLLGRWKLQFLCWGSPAGTGKHQCGLVGLAVLGRASLHFGARTPEEFFWQEILWGNDAERTWAPPAAALLPPTGCAPRQGKLICWILETENTNNLRIIQNSLDTEPHLLTAVPLCMGIFH